jgi:hypothetical protein
MTMARGRKKKGPWDDLDEAWRNEMMSSASDDSRINDEIRQVALYAVRMEEVKAADQDLAQKKAEAATAGAIYREAKTTAKLKTAFLRDVLRSRGRALPGD